MAIQDEASTEFQDVRVVDTDVHITGGEELQREIAKRMDEPWRGYADPDRTPARYRQPSPGLPKPLGGTKSFVIERGLPNAEVIREDLMDRLGVDHPIVNQIGLLDTMFKTDRAIEQMRAMNDILLEHFLDDNDDFYGLAMISLRDPHATAEEIDRLGEEEQVVGAFVYFGTSHQKPPGDPSYDVVYEALDDNDLTPAFHTSNYIRRATHLREYENLFAWHTLGPSWAMQEVVVSLISQGTPEKFPDMNFVVMEGGLGWIPFMMGRLNREQGQWRSEIPYLERTPEEYIRDQFYFSTQPLEEFNDPDHMRAILEIIGTDSLVFATDYPHYDFDDPSAIDGYLRAFEAGERERVLADNAIEAFGLPL